MSPDHTVEQVDVPVAGNGTDSRSAAALAQLRDKLIPATIGRVPGATADVAGYTASSADFNDTLKSHAPVVFIFVLTAAFILLLFTFRSLVIPLKAILLNLLSVGAAYGVLVWIFQEGHLQSVLGFKSNGAIVSWMPLFLFVVLFGLSMDYHVFILTRIREAFDRGRRNRGRGLPRDQVDRRRGHQRRGRDDLRVRDLRHPVAARSSRNSASASRWQC